MHWRTSLSASCSRTCCGQKGQGREDRVPGHNQAHIQSMWCLTSDRLGICSNRRESGHHTRSSPNPAQGVGERGGRWSTANWWPVPSISAKVSVTFWSSLSAAFLCSPTRSCLAVRDAFNRTSWCSHVQCLLCCLVAKKSATVWFPTVVISRCTSG